MKNKLLPLSLITIILFFAAAAVIHVKQKPQIVENIQNNPNKQDANQSGQTQQSATASKPSIAKPPQQIQPSQVKKTGAQYTLFYGDGCPHCAKVETFIQQNDIISQLSLESKEVYHNADNASLLSQAVKSCGMNTDSIGVPFLYDGSKCIVGDADIISFFQQKLNTQ